MYSDKDNKILIFDIQDHWKTSIYEDSKDFIIEKNSVIKELKDVPISHYFIDFSHIILNRKLAELLENPDVNFDKSILFNDFEMADLMLMTNENYGLEIEQQPCLRNVIDFIFEEQTKSLILYQFVVYVALYVTPFIA